jgi:drug/metabolite transporter (DMT)-like permease
MKTEYLWIAGTALLWGSYPLVSRTAGYQGHRATLFLMVAAFVPITIAAVLDTGSGWPSRGALWKLLVAGVMMGGGLLAFIRVANGPLDASVSLPILDVAMLLVSAIGAILAFQEPVTLQKLGGIALMVVGIALLRPS